MPKHNPEKPLSRRERIDRTNGLLEEEVNRAKEFFSKGDMTGLSPMLIVYLRVDGTMQMGLIALEGDSFNNKDARFEILETLGSAMSKKYPDSSLEATFMVSEAWLKRYPKEDGDKMVAGEKDYPASLEKEAEKQEVIVIAGLDSTGIANMATAEIIRDPDNQILLADFDIMPYEEGSNTAQPSLLRQFHIGWSKVRAKKVNEWTTLKGAEHEHGLG